MAGKGSKRTTAVMRGATAGKAKTPPPAAPVRVQRAIGSAKKGPPPTGKRKG